MFKDLMDYKGLNKAIKNFGSGHKKLHREEIQGASSSGTSKKILQTSDARSFQHLGNMVNKLAYQFADLSLFVNKQFGRTTPPVKTDADNFCSFCNQEGHGASGFQHNQHRHKSCTICGRREHSEAVCWSKNPPRDDPRGEVARARSESGE